MLPNIYCGCDCQLDKLLREVANRVSSELPTRNPSKQLFLSETRTDHRKLVAFDADLEKQFIKTLNACRSDTWRYRSPLKLVHVNGTNFMPVTSQAN